MTERILGPTGGGRRKRFALLLPFMALAALILAIGASAGQVSDAAGFEGADANLADNAAVGIDWNTFDPVDWTGTAPDRVAIDLEAGWQFEGLEDAQVTTSDDSFAGGTKQDDACATVNTGKAPNKDDLKRIYLASKTVSGHTYLMLGWVRIPQNSPAPSAHIGFEFNSGGTACSNGSGLVQRTADNPATPTVNEADMLIIYNFEGGNTTPIITLSRWVTSGSCDVGSNNPPCWSPKVVLPPATAEAQVNHGGGSVPGAGIVDELSPPSTGQASVSETLGVKEFGEAAIDLTNAGVFAPGLCATFGTASAVSRSSGQTEQAQMKDLVGPASFTLTNCGSLQVVKNDPDGGPLSGAQFKIYKDDSDGVFEPSDGNPAGADVLQKSCTTTGDGTGNCTLSSLLIGDKYWVLETQAPSGYVIPASQTNPLLITITSSGVHTATFTNNPALGDLKVVKKDDANNLMSGVTFTLKGTSDVGNLVDLSCTTVSGECTFSNVEVGTYTLDEDATTLPAGYSKDPSLPKSVAVTSGSLTTVNVTNPRTHKVIVIVCHEGTNTLATTPVQELPASSATNPTPKNSIGQVPAGLVAKTVTQADLCGIGGASFGGLGHADKDLRAQLGNITH